MHTIFHEKWMSETCRLSNAST